MAEGTGKGSSHLREYGVFLTHAPYPLCLPSPFPLGEWVRGSARGRLPLCLLIAADTATFQRW